MKIGIIGAGFVGLSFASVLGSKGYQVIVHDVDTEKLGKIKAGKPPFFEPKLKSTLKNALKLSLELTSDIKKIVNDCDLIFITVGTPIGNNGNISLTDVKEVANKIGRVLKKSKNKPVIVVKSTVTPGTNNLIRKILEEKSGKKSGTGFSLLSNPEFLREGSAIADTIKPHIIVLGGENTNATDKLAKFYKKFYSSKIPFYMHDQFLSEKHPYGFQLPSKLLLFGDITKETLLEKGYPKDRLIAFGNPTYFHLKDKVEFDKKSIIEKFHLPKNKQFVLFAPPGMKDYTENQINYNEEIVKKLLQDFKDNNELFFLIKPHPADNPDDYKKIMAEFGSVNAKIIDASLIESLIISDLVVSTFSTTIIDSMCLKKPVIQVTFSGIKYHRPYDEFNAVLQTPLPELSEKILYLLNNESEKSVLIENGNTFAKKYYNFPHVQSIENLKEILLSK